MRKSKKQPLVFNEPKPEENIIAHSILGKKVTKRKNDFWTCPGCGELNGNLNELCWQCSVPRP